MLLSIPCNTAIDFKLQLCIDYSHWHFEAVPWSCLVVCNIIFVTVFPFAKRSRMNLQYFHKIFQLQLQLWNFCCASQLQWSLPLLYASLSSERRVSTISIAARKLQWFNHPVQRSFQSRQHVAWRHPWKSRWRSSSSRSINSVVQCFGRREGRRSNLRLVPEQKLHSSQHPTTTEFLLRSLC